MDSFDKKPFFVKGRIVEEEFNRLVNGTFSSIEDNIYQHYDISIHVKIDVKGMKKIKRHDAEPSDDYHYVEIKGTTGHLGWLYGNADYIAFEMKYQWLLVPLQALQDLVHSRCEKIFRSEPLPYQLYRRTQDVMTLVPVTDLINISSNIIQKYGKL